MIKQAESKHSRRSTKRAEPKPAKRKTQEARSAAPADLRAKKAARRASGSAPAKGRTPSSSTSDFRIKVRMYRQGLGDFFLVTLPRAGGKVFRMLIDCGVITGTPDGKNAMRNLVTQMKSDVGSRLDVVVVTHRHADHISGFLQAEDIFKAAFDIGEVWVSWVENPRDKLGQQLLSTHQQAEQALRVSAERLRLSGAPAAEEIASLLDFRGEPLAAGATGSTTDAAVDIAKKLGPLRFCRPDDQPHKLDGTGAQVFVLGPPRDLALLGRMDPSKANPETYGVTAMRSLLRDIAPALGLGDDGGAGAQTDDGSPFGANWKIPLGTKTVPPFFGSTYLDEAAGWRRIDDDWLEGSSALALAFDEAVNNTSLVLAIELDGGDVLLFAADAQVGNWLSWQALKWNLPGRGEITAADLLKRTIFYKVGHHASHNATLQAQGLELMDGLQYAMISVNEDMARKKNWGQMPFPKLLTALETHTGSRAVRADKDIPPAANAKVKSGPGFYELTL